MTRTEAKRSRGAAVIIAQQAAEPFAAIEDALRASDFVSRFDQLVVETLMMAFVVIVSRELAQGVAQRPITEGDHAVQTFGFGDESECFRAGLHQCGEDVPSGQVRGGWRFERQCVRSYGGDCNGSDGL